MDSDQFRQQGKYMVDFIADYMTNIRDQNVLPFVEPGYLSKILPSSAPDDDISFEQVMSFVQTAIMPGMTHWHHPNFYAFYPTAFSFPSILGSMLSDGFACIGLSWQASPACTELEVLVLDWLVKAMNLPPVFLSTSENGGGTILSSASEASLMILLTERNSIINLIQKKNPEMQHGEITDKMVVYITKQAHSSVERACKISLLKFKYVSTLDDESMDVDDLIDLISKDKESNLIPLMVIAAFGSTSLCSFDNLYEIGKACKLFKIKCHVDAAYAGSFLICPEFQHLARGLELINSFCFNAHKLMRTHFDCSILWTDNRSSSKETLAVNPLYLAHDYENVTTELRNWQIPLGRRFRSLKLWFVLNMFGIKKLQENIRMHFKLAKIFEEKVVQSEIFQLVNRVDFGLVCFRIKNSNEKTRRLYELLKFDHSIFLSSSLLEKHDIFFLRFVCSMNTTENDVTETYNKIYKAAMTL